MTDFWTDVLSFAQTTTARVGTQLLQDFGQVQASQKADGSLVTQADRWADEEIRNAIAYHYPHHGILSEEAEHQFPDTEWCWIIDPLDGNSDLGNFFRITISRNACIWLRSFPTHWTNISWLLEWKIGNNRHRE